jgi:enoyl-CoA hydratase
VSTGRDRRRQAGSDEQVGSGAVADAARSPRSGRSRAIGQAARVAKPLIGAVNGATFTGGLELALGCDFLIASDRASFADTHARVGVLPGGGLTVRLPLLVGPAWARRMSLTGGVVPHERLLGRALEPPRRPSRSPAPPSRGCTPTSPAPCRTPRWPGSGRWPRPSART